MRYFVKTESFPAIRFQKENYNNQSICKQLV